MELKDWIKERGLQIKWVGKQLGISESYIYRIVNHLIEPGALMKRHIDNFCREYDKMFQKKFETEKEMMKFYKKKPRKAKKPKEENNEEI